MKRIAIAEDDGEIAEHLGKAKTMHFFDIEEGKILKDEKVPCTGEGHEYILSLLDRQKAEVLICGNLGKPAIDGLLERGIDIYPALVGDVQEGAIEYADGSLPKVSVEYLLHLHCCHHHEEGDCCCHDGCDDSCCCGEEEESK